MSITLSVLGFALSFSVAFRRLPDLDDLDAGAPRMEANGAGQFELAHAEPLWSGDEFGFRGVPDGR